MNESLHSDLADLVVRKSIPRKTVQQKQQQIYNDSLRLSRAMASPNFTRVGKDDLQRMAKMYDAMFFEGMLLPLAQKEGLTFGWSARMTKNAGKTVTHYPAGYRRGDPRRFEIILSSPLLFQTFSDINRPVEVTGVMCQNRLQAMQRVLEHELVHLIEMLVWDDSSCSKSPFQKIANRFFGHTQHQHDLITQRERAARKFKIGVGTHVRFDYEGQALRGVVNRITRRATVLVPDAGGAMFNDGKRYRKYYVPLEHLRHNKTK